MSMRNRYWILIVTVVFSFISIGAVYAKTGPEVSKKVSARKVQIPNVGQIKVSDLFYAAREGDACSTSDTGKTETYTETRCFEVSGKTYCCDFKIKIECGGGVWFIMDIDTVPGTCKEQKASSGSKVMESR